MLFSFLRSHFLLFFDFSCFSPLFLCSNICPSGKFTDTLLPHLDLNIQCKDCPTGRYIEDEAIDETKHESETNCLHCPRGYEFENKSKCQVCGFSKYQDQSDLANVMCKICPENKFIADDRLIADAHLVQGSCLDCKEGKFAAAGDRFCDTCSAGRERKDSSCDDCSLGKFGESKKSCVDCPTGYYQDSSGAASCLPCIP